MMKISNRQNSTDYVIKLWKGKYIVMTLHISFLINFVRFVLQLNKVQ